MLDLSKKFSFLIGLFELINKSSFLERRNETSSSIPIWISSRTKRALKIPLIRYVQISYKYNIYIYITNSPPVKFKRKIPFNVSLFPRCHTCDTETNIRIFLASNDSLGIISTLSGQFHEKNRWAVFPFPESDQRTQRNSSISISREPDFVHQRWIFTHWQFSSDPSS